MTKLKLHSFNKKITFSFIILGFILLGILFIQIIPNMQEEQRVYKKHQMEHMIVLTKNQLQFAIELLKNERKNRVNKIRQKLDNEIKPFVHLLNNTENKQETLLKLQKQTQCDAFILNGLNQTLYKTEINDLSAEKKENIQNELVFFSKKQKHMCPKSVTRIMYWQPLSNTKKLLIDCDPKLFRSNHYELEARIKDDLQKSFKLTSSDHKGKINLIWINAQHTFFETQPLYHFNDKYYNDKYCLSKMSSASYPQTGYLTAKQIIDAANKEPIQHKINSKEKPTVFKDALTWVSSLKVSGDKELFFLITVYEEDFNKHLNEPFLKVLPAAVFALIIAILLGIIIFKRLFRSINILNTTVKEVNLGNKSARNNLYGDDDIAVLAQAFDNMLDTVEKNIQGLDKQVELKTQQLQHSLNEKETLLKEIHHRVKNNLAMTINLIKLQKSKVKDEQTKTILVDIQERIFTMELLHRKLYESKDLNSIPLKKYIIELVEDLNRTYGSNQHIKINTQIDDVCMNIEYALPCGLIITECLTNSFKYAFDNGEGKIDIILQDKNNGCLLIIADSGIGLPLGFDIHRCKSLGLRLITSIVKGQLQGNIDYTYEEGSKFAIAFDYEQ